MSASRKRKIVLFTAAVLAGIGGIRKASATVYTDWDFDNVGSPAGTIAPPYNTAPATTGTGTATQLGMTNNYVFANGEGPGSVANGDVTPVAGASTGAGSAGWRVRGNSNSKNAGPGNANGWNSNAPIATQGAEFETATPATTDHTITVQFDINATGQAEQNLAVLYTLDDTVGSPTWIDATISSGGLGTIANGNATDTNTIDGSYFQLNGLGTGWNNQITATIAGADNDPNFAIEIVNASTGADCVNTGGTALNNSSGNWRFDNVIVGNDLPEPASIGFLTVGALPLMSRRRKAAR